MTRKFKWGKNNKCGIIGCDKQIDWGEFTSYLACENHRNRKWGQCEACQNQKTTHTVYYDIYHGDDNAERSVKEVREGINFQKEIIESLFSKNISNSLREKLNISHQKAQEAEKIIPELEKLTQEYWEKKLNCASDLISEKGGQQTNIYESNLCDSCGDEVNEQQQKLKSDYQTNALDKLVVFDPETNTQIEKEIGRNEAQKVAYELSLASKNKGIEKEQGITRYHFLRKLPFFGKSKYSKQHSQNKKADFLKLKQYFQDHSIKQIREIGSSNYFFTWYADGNIEGKYISLPVKWSNFTWHGLKSISLYEINRVLKELDQVPSPSKEEEEASLGRNEKPEKGGVVKADSLNDKEKPFLSSSERELIKKFFQQNKIKKISLKNGELVIIHNNNEVMSNEKLNDLDLEYQLIKDNLQTFGQEELTAKELGLSANTSASTTEPSTNKYLWVGGGITTGIIISVLLVFLLRKKKKN